MCDKCSHPALALLGWTANDDDPRWAFLIELCAAATAAESFRAF
jgi:hypothetical protein